MRSRFFRALAVAAGLSLSLAPFADATAQAEPKKKGAKKQVAPAAPKPGGAQPGKLVGGTADDEGKSGRPKSDPDFDAKKEELADQKRDVSINRLKAIIPRFEDGNPQKADLLYQLSELYWQKSEYLFRKEMREHEQRYLAYEAAVNRGEKQEAPKEDHRQSELFRRETMGLYETILREYPAYARKDEVLFSLGQNLYEVGKKAEGVKRYNELIKNYPQSRFVADAYVQLGNHYFDVENDLVKAKSAYENALKSNQPKIYSYALYKLGWCDYNAGEHEKSLKKFQDVVAYASQRGKEMTDLKSEALRDMVVVFVRLNRPDDAVAYFKANAGKKTSGRLVARLANGLQDGGFHESAIKVFRGLIAEDPMRKEAPEYQQAIVKSYEGLRQRDQVRTEIKRLAELYSPGGTWWKANEGKADVLRNAFNVAEEAMRSIVTEYHQEAQKTKQVETYRLARDIYKQYVDAFASSQDEAFISDFGFNLSFYYAEILWALEEWEPAAVAYQKVVDFKIPKRDTAKEVSQEKYRQSAAYNAILAFDKLVKIERGQLQKTDMKAGAKVDEQKKKGNVEKGQKITKKAVELKEEPLTKWEQKLVVACDTYNTLYPKNAEEIDVRYQAAVLYYDRNHFVEAAKRLGEIILKWPEERRSQDAADLSMYVLEAKEEWLQLNQLSRQFLGNKKLTKAGTEFAKRVGSVVEGSQYKWVDEVIYKKDKNAARAAEEFLKFVAEFPKSENADRALTYAMIIFQDANQLDRGVETGERVLKEYPESVFEMKVRYTLANFYEKVADFEKSAQMYEAFIAAYDEASGETPPAVGSAAGAKGAKKAARAAPKKKAGKTPAKPRNEEEWKQLLAEAKAWVPDAQFNAALWWEGLGKYEKAIQAYELYMARFKDRKDVPEIHFNIALILEKQKKLPEALKQFESFNTTFAKDGRTTPAMHYRSKYRQMLAHQQLKNGREAEKLQDELLKSYAKLPEADRKNDAVLNAYAHCRFNGLEPLWSDYKAIQFKKVATLKKDFATKQKKIQEVEKAYADVLAIGSGEYGISSLIRIGLAYGDFAQNIIDSPDPRGFDEDQLSMYRSELENLAFPLEDKALEALEKALARAYDLSIYNEATLQAQDRINKYRPGHYAKAREVAYQGSEHFATASVLTQPQRNTAQAPASAPAPKPAAPEQKTPAPKAPSETGSAPSQPATSASAGGAL